MASQSEVWLHFSKDTDSKVKCSYCDKRFGYKDSSTMSPTTSPIRHLASQHDICCNSSRSSFRIRSPLRKNNHSSSSNSATTSATLSSTNNNSAPTQPTVSGQLLLWSFLNGEKKLKANSYRAGN